MSNQTFTGLDGFVIKENTPYYETQILIHHFLEYLNQSTEYDKDGEGFLVFVEKNQTQAKEILLALGERQAQAKEDYAYSFGKWVEYLFENAKSLFNQEDILHFWEIGVEKICLAYKEQLLPYISKYFYGEKLNDKLKETLQKYLEEKCNYRSNNWRVLSNILEINNPVELTQNQFDADFGKGNLEQKLYGNYLLYDQDKYYEAQVFLEKHFKAEEYFYPFTRNPIFSMIQDKDRTFLKNLAMACFYRLAFEHFYPTRNNFAELIQELCRKKLPFTEDELLLTYKGFANKLFDVFEYSYTVFSVLQHFKNVEDIVKKKGITEKVKKIFEYIIQTSEYTDDKGLAKVVLKVRQMMAKEGIGTDEVAIKITLSEQDIFGKQVNEYLNQHQNPSNWYQILQLANTAIGGKPSKKFQKQAKDLIKDTEGFITTMEIWLDTLAKAKNSTGKYDEEDEHSYTFTYFLNKNNQDIAKGLVWIIAQLENTQVLYPHLYRLAMRSFEKIPGIGPAATSLGNACIYTLSAIKDLVAVSYLTRLRLKIRQKNTRTLIEKYIQTSAKTLGVSQNLLEDMSVQEYHLKDGKAIHKFEDYELHIEIEGIGKVSQKWFKPDGKTQKSVPAFVKKDFAVELKAIKTELKEIQQTLTAQRDRLDRSYIYEVFWKYSEFQKYYEAHGLMSFLAKRLIWKAHKDSKELTIFWQNDAWKTIDNQAITWLEADTEIRLWHPVETTVEDVLAWRAFMQTHQIVQPIKQAYREIYILTDAEINTKFYSNRMAAHILKQHQFNALAGLRNWKYSLLGAYDDGRDDEVASLDLPKHKLKAEFWINEILDNGDSFNDAGIWLYVSTDQVRFTQYNDEVLDLAEVPKLIFSEVMRDVDLFVGVGSVGNDPEWADNAGNPQQRTYWHTYSFGDLSEIAKTRKTILENVLPKLKIAQVSEIDGNFLRVKGTFTTYKIHIGSTNILMEPNDQYLCIVPSRKKENTGNVFLPFEGDRGFSVLLSKAMMLANDTKITDSTILSQIKRQ